MTAPRIEPAAAPGGLVFVLYDATDTEVDRFVAVGEAAGITAAAEVHAYAVLEHGGMVRVFDGDSGELAGALGLTDAAQLTRTVAVRLDGCTCAAVASSHKPPCPWAWTSR